MSIPDRWTGRPRDVIQSAGMAGASRSAILSRVTFHGPKDYLDAARDPATTAAELQSLAECPFVFVHLALAERPDTPLEALRLIVPHEAGGWNENRLLRLLAANPNADATVLRAVGQVIAAFLSTVHPAAIPTAPPSRSLPDRLPQPTSSMNSSSPRGPRNGSDIQGGDDV